MMFRNKDRRKLMRNRSTESVGTEQPAPPVPSSNTSTTTNSPSKQQPKKQQQQAQQQQPLTASTTTYAPPALMPRRSTTLHRTTASLSAYRATPITKHYSLNNQILAAFESHYENKHYPVAYAIGFQFVETALLEIPKHGYFYSTRHTQERTSNSLNAIRVSSMLQTILEHQRQQQQKQQQNQSALNNNNNEWGIWDLDQELTKVQKLSVLALEQAQESSYEEYEAHRAALEAELNEMKKQEPPQTLLGETCGPLLDSFTETMCPPGGFAALMNCATDPKISPATTTTTTTTMTSAAVPDAIPPPPLQQQQRSMSTIMREMMQQPPRQPHATSTVTTTATATVLPTATATVVSSIPPATPLQPGIQVAEPIGVIHRPPSLHPTVSAVSRASIPPPPVLDGGGWMVLPEVMPERPEFGRQMSGRTYADHVALERALYLSGLEVQPELYLDGDDPRRQEVMMVVEDDDQWMLEHALKESQREMEALREQEELQILQACEQSEQQIYQPMKTYHDQYQLQRTYSGVMQPPQLQRRYTKSRLEIETLHMLYHEDFVHLWNSGRVRVTHVDTYQGKNPGSTNGCTVIAPLLCIHHFINFAETGFNGEPRDDPGLPDETIKSVIDEEVPSILPKVREELGVVQDAFLIPSDSHDYLLKNQLLSQDQFVTVIGGNILDERHLNELIRTLVEGCVPVDAAIKTDEASTNGDSNNHNHQNNTGAASNNHDPAAAAPNGPYASPGATHVNNPKKRDLRKAKIACTLFFHEHVVSILKLRRANGGKAWFDIIDSLPSKQMLSKELGQVTSMLNPENNPHAGAGAGNNGANLNGDGSIQVDEFGIPLSETYEVPMNTARIRCLDEEALSVALRWYACARFNTENLNYIDTYPWDDHSTDFDPRVFQAFVWAEAA